MTTSAFRFCDDLGPKTILHVYQPVIGLRAIVVVDNVAAGPAIGGVRMAPDVSLEECFRLARAMTFKNASAGLPHGGAKSVIFGDPTMHIKAKEELIRAYAQAIMPITDYIPGPDMGTNEAAMAWIKDEGGQCAGLPKEVGGIPLDEIGATAYGVVASADIAREHVNMSLDGARIAVQGFGAVGKHAARFFAEKGSVLVAAADSSGTIYDARGIDVAALIAYKDNGGRIRDYELGEQLSPEAVVGVDCDILVPAARPDVIRADNQATVKARLIVPGANIGVTEEAEAMLHKRGVLCVPDFIANAGGVICAAVEYGGGTQGQVFPIIDEKVRGNTAETLERMKSGGILPREAAVAMARERVGAAMRYQRFNSRGGLKKPGVDFVMRAVS
ncbi:MAG: Glu/Leu/Phe/Val dehydrogenase [Gammaproteobacteria bacterium]|nr:Glu/Leu/Phe/Val dehydrogenase [Gammaproteobacteria bacterium]MDH3410237.1 Glu/Leu/Phe/Val dehydrogenase [Gammaproteobacteria bacterium]MDH3551686.1 Glu/Leu/Phe/Val dehydrogenase [Gammaproteobacteria bacterium]